MADKPDVKSVELNLVDRLYVRRALELLQKSLQRSKANEVAGSEIWHIREKEIDGLSVLIRRLA